MLTITSLLTRVERVYGHRPAIVDAEGTFTWSQFIDRVRRAAGADAGAQPHHRQAVEGVRLDRHRIDLSQFDRPVKREERNAEGEAEARDEESSAFSLRHA